MCYKLPKFKRKGQNRQNIMQPKDNSFEASHVDLFRSSLDQILDRQHPLYVLAHKIDWKRFDYSFGALFAQKKGEFGCKVSMVSISQGNFILAIDALHGIPFDGHTLKNALQQMKKHTGWQPLHAYCDKGYQGVAQEIAETEVLLSGKQKKRMKASHRTDFRSFEVRSSIGVESSQRKKTRSDDAILSGCGLSLRKLIRAFFLFIFQWLFYECFSRMDRLFEKI